MRTTTDELEDQLKEAIQLKYPDAEVVGGITIREITVACLMNINGSLVASEHRIKITKNENNL